MPDTEETTGQEKTYGGMTRRSVVIGASGAVVLLAMGGLKATPAEAQVRPPGGQDEDRMISACIRCERCVESCPRNAIHPTHIEDGILGVRMPSANFNIGWCDFCQEENGGDPLCVSTCPSNALALADGANAKNTILGKAVIIKNWCLAWSKYNGCRFCYDACPSDYAAIYLDEYNRPLINRANCVGCGACQSVCVSLQEGSIAAGATSRACIVVPESKLSNYEE